MKPFIFAMALTILYTTFSIYQHDHNAFIRQQEQLKYVADESSASASLFYDTTEYSEGRKVFNRTEGIKALEDILKRNLKLDDFFIPLPNTYWREKIEYKVYFYDESNTTFPFVFTDPTTSYVKTLTEPTVIITVDAGKPRYRLSFLNPVNTVRSSAYEYETR